MPEQFSAKSSRSPMHSTASRKAEKRSGFSRGIPLSLVHPDEDDDTSRGQVWGYAASENQVNDWENEKSKFGLQAQREKLKRQFTVFLGEEIVGQVIRAHTSIDDARRALR